MSQVKALAAHCLTESLRSCQRSFRPVSVRMNDDEEFLPYEEDSDDELQAHADVAQPNLTEYEDDEVLLRNHTDAEDDSGWDTGADTDAAFSGDETDPNLSGAEPDEEELFPEGADAMALLAGMEGGQQEADNEALQPYEVLARQKRLARRKQVLQAAGKLQQLAVCCS